MNYDRLHSTKIEVAKQLGYFPAFLVPAINSSLVFRSLVQQTLSAYINNPLPKLFKEKLFIYLSYYFGFSYFTICHSCTMQFLGVDPAEILKLKEIEYPRGEKDIAADLEVIREQCRDGQNWQHNSQLETSLLRCSFLIFWQPSQTIDLAQTLKQLLGTVDYNYLMLLLGYIKLCHQWIESHPEISYQQDRRSQLYLGSLLLSNSKLAQFFQTNIKHTVEQNRCSAKVTTSDASLSLAIKNGSRSSLIKNNWQFRQATLTTFFSDVPFPVVIHSQDGKILYLNRSGMEVIGHKTSDISTAAQGQQKAQVKRFSATTVDRANQANENQVLSKVYLGAQTQDSVPQISAFLSNLAEKLNQIGIENGLERAIKSEFTIITTKGEQLCYQSYCAPLHLEHEPELKISIIEEATEVVSSQRLSRHSRFRIDKTDELALTVGQTRRSKTEDWFKLAQNDEKIGSWNYSLVDNKIYFCDRGCEILGLDNFDGNYKSFLQLIHPNSRESADLAIVGVIAHNQDLDLKYPIVKLNYDICWIRLQGKLRYNSESKPIGLSGIIMNLTSQESISLKANRNYVQGQQQQVTQSVKELKNVIDLLPAYVCVIDTGNFVVSLMNQKLARSLGFSPDNLVLGKSISEYFTPDHTCKILCQQQQVLTDGEEMRVQEKVILADGVHNFDTTITPLHNDDGQIYALLHTSNDIPDLAATKAALSQRTLQLEAANKELESFSFSVSHDLQAPLRVINGFSQVLWENYQFDLDDRGKHYLQRIQANSEKMSDLIDALLQLSRVTRSQMKSVMIDLSKMAQDIVDELQNREPKRQVEIRITPNLKTEGDPQLLRIVLSNLLDNAWKYTSKRSQAKIEFDAISVAERQIAYFVRDNGAGFDLEYADKLFTAFKRLHTQEEFPGTGIGLATVQRIIYRHGGRVWAESECDRGATIYFSF